MLAHLHQPDIDRIATHRAPAADWPQIYRHLDDCELCLRRLIDDVLRLASVEAGEPTRPAAAFTS